MSTNNDFVSLAVPSSAGIGAPSDISDMSFGLSLIVEGPASSTGEIVIEASQDGVNFAPVTAVFPLNNPPSLQLQILARFARVNRFSGSGPAVVVIASAKTGLNIFGTLSLSPLDTSEMGPLKTIVVVGQYSSPIVIEGSGDGTNYDSVASFSTQDSDTISISGTWATMRVRPNTVLDGVSVALGSGFVAGAGGTGGAVTQIVAGTNVTVSPLSGVGVVTVNADDPPAAPVTRIIAGTNVTVSPISGLGNVTVNATGGGGGGSVADWGTDVMRVYAIDPVSGDDTNAGFATPASPSQADYQAACAAAGLVAKKTFAGLGAIFPKYGAGRQVEVVIANGGVNTEGTFAEDLAVFLGSCFGYAAECPFVRGTGTNATAGCTKFDGTLNDVIYEGGITATGRNVNGYNPTGAATSTSLPCTLNGGGAPALPAEPASPLGWRIRFAANTNNPALRNVARQIARVTGGNTIIPQTDLGSAPTAADVFYIEQAGVAWTLASDIGGTGLGNPNASGGSTGRQATISGLRGTNTLKIADTNFLFVFSGINLFTATGGSHDIEQSVSHPVYGAVAVGGGLRVENSLVADGPATVNAVGLVLGAALFSGSISFRRNSKASWGQGCFASSLFFEDYDGITRSTGFGNSPVADVGRSDSVVPSPRANLCFIEGSKVLFGLVTIENSGNSPAITLVGQCQIWFALGPVDGSTGNNNVGLDLQNSVNSLIIMSRQPTVTGTAGDIRLSNGVIVSWAQAFTSGFTDPNGNRFISDLHSGGAGGPPLGYVPFTGAILGGVGATQSYLADSGLVGAVNQTTPFKRPTSNRFMMRLLVSVSSNTSVNTVTVTLIKNNVATTMQISVPAGTTGQFTSTNIVMLVSGDTWDVRIDDAADAGALVALSAALEYAA